MSRAPLSRRTFLLSSAAAATLAITSACSDGKKSSPGTGSSAGGPRSLEKVIYLTAFGKSAREMYAAVGIAKNFFKDAGIDLVIQPGQPSDANLKALAAGQAQFASVDYVSAVRGTKTYLENGVPNFAVTAAIQKSTLLSAIAMNGKNINQPTDLAGKTIATGANAASATLFPTYAKLAGIDASKITFQAAPDASQLPTLLIAGTVQAIGTYSVDKPLIEAAAKAKGVADPTTVVFPYADFVTDLFGSVIIAPTSLIKSKADLVQRFNTAILKGMKYATENPAEGAKIIADAVEDPKVADGAAKTYELIKPYVGDGSLDPAKVMRSIALLESAQLAPAGLKPEQLVAFDVAPKMS